MSGIEKPMGYGDDLSDYGPVVYDSHCTKPIGWGFKIVRYLGEERFKSLAEHGDLECLSIGVWCLVTRKLTPAEAVAEYGEVTKLEVGKFGGYRAATYGSIKFVNRWLDPRNKVPLADGVVTVLTAPPRPLKKKRSA